MKLYWIGRYNNTLHYKEFDRVTESYGFYGVGRREKLVTEYRTYSKTVEEAIQLAFGRWAKEKDRAQDTYNRAVVELDKFRSLAETGRFKEEFAKEEK